MAWSWVTAAGIFASYVVLDALYALYTASVNQLRPARAAGLAAALYGLGAVWVRDYVANPWYVLPLVAGSALGTFATVWCMKRWK